MTYRTILKFAYLAMLALALPANASVINTITFQAEANGGDEETASDGFNETDSGAPTFTSSASASAIDNANSIRGLAASSGAADNDGETLSFAQASSGLGAHSSSGVTEVTQVITNDAAFTAMGSFRSEILAGGLLLLVDDNRTLDGFIGGASFSFTISLDGDSLLEFGASITSDGGIVSNNIGFLNGLAPASNMFANGLSWADTGINLDLGAFDPGETKVLEFRLETNTFDTTGCLELTTSDCMIASASIGDPEDFGFGYAMLYSTYLPPEGVPAPAPAGLILLSLAAICLRRSMGKMSTV